MKFSRTSPKKRFAGLGIAPVKSPQEATALVMSFYKCYLKYPEYEAEFKTTAFQYPQEAERTDVYAYQTKDNGFIKFGIAQNHEVRAKRAGANEKDRYSKYLYHITTNTRYEAQTVESLLKKRLDIGWQKRAKAELRSYSVEVTTKHKQEVIAAIDQSWDDVQSKGVIEMRKTLRESSFKLLWRMTKRIYRGLAFVNYLKVYEDDHMKQTIRAKPSDGIGTVFQGYAVRLCDHCESWEFNDFVRQHKKDAVSSQDVLKEWGVDVSEFRGF